MAIGGGTWVLWLLVVLSVISIIIMVERALTFYRIRFQDEQFIKDLRPCLREADWDKARELCETSQSLEPQILLAGLNQVPHGKDSASEAMEAERIRVNLQLGKGLNFLGTLGANAPFIGLFGTVLGIIHAFKDLALTEGGGGPAVMAGIAEALVATAVGLLVAIPAVVMYNYYHGRLHIVLERSQRLGRMLLARLSSTQLSESSSGGSAKNWGTAMKLHRHGPITEINMTPFVDIVLVILIIFLLTATVMMPRTFSITLPKATEADKLEKTVVIISIDREGKIAINGTRVHQEMDFNAIFTEQVQGKEPQAVIAADKETKHGNIIEVINRLKRLKVERIGIEVEQP